MWEQVRRVLKPRGVFVTTASQPFTSALVMSNLEWFRYALVWEKAHAANFMAARYMPLMKHEDVLVFCDGATIYHPQIRKGLPKMNRSGHVIEQRRKDSIYGNRPAILANVPNMDYQPTSVQFFSAGAMCERIHPTQKPVALYEYLIRTYTNAGDLVVDFCFGSGTTGVAAVQTGRRFLGCEISEEYFHVAQCRIADAQARPRLFEDAPTPQPQQAHLLGEPSTTP